LGWSTACPQNSKEKAKQGQSNPKDTAGDSGEKVSKKSGESYQNDELVCVPCVHRPEMLLNRPLPAETRTVPRYFKTVLGHFRTVLGYFRLCERPAGEVKSGVFAHCSLILAKTHHPAG